MRSMLARLAVVVGLCALFALLVVACSTSNAPAACKDSCNGCCQGDTCIALADQGQLSCGTNGQACIACLSGNICSEGGCVPAPPPPDSGLPTPDGGPKQDAGSQCGGQGQVCCRGNTCEGLVLNCFGGVCLASPPDAGADAGVDAGTGKQDIGGACSNNTGCKSNDCATSGNGFPSGYCTASCTGGCPAGSACGTIVGGSQNYCLATCPAPGTQSTCRAGYVCEKNNVLVHSNGSGVCVPQCTTGSTAQCGQALCSSGGTANGFCSQLDGYACCTGSNCGGTACNSGNCGADGYCGSSSGTKSATGSACAADVSCTGSICFPQTDAGVANCPPGSTTCWPGGYCSQNCNGSDGNPDNSKCASGSACSNFGVGVNDCVETCVYNPSSAQSSCRAGYVCDKFTATSTGDSSCTSACNSQSYCTTFGATDCQNGFCCGGNLFHCCAGNTCQAGLTCDTNSASAYYQYCH